MSDSTEGSSQGLEQILQGFQRFSGGVTARRIETIDTQHALSHEIGTVTAPIPLVNGELPGEIAGVDFWVPLNQLRLAPAEDLLNNRYDPKEDPDFDLLKASLVSMGENIPSLPVLPANRNLRLGDGTEKPIFLIYDMPYVYYALIDLKRIAARVHIPKEGRPGATLLQSMGREGQLRREPSVIEICKASKRLKEYYGYTVEEIAEQQAANREDRSRPSPQQIYNQINVAGLPEIVQDMLHHKQILWTHARDLAEAFLGDDVLCERLAILVSQGRRLTVDEFVQIIHRVRGKLSIIEQGEDGVVYERRLGAIQLLEAPAGAKRQKVSANETITYEHMMVARPALIHREATRFKPVLIAADTPQQVALTPESLSDLRTWLGDQRGNVPVQRIEAVLLGFLQSVRTTARDSGLINAQGVLASLVDAQKTDTGS